MVLGTMEYWYSVEKLDYTLVLQRSKSVLAVEDKLFRSERFSVDRKYQKLDLLGIKDVGYMLIKLE